MRIGQGFDAKVLILVLLDALFRGEDCYDKKLVKAVCLNPCFTGWPFQGPVNGLPVGKQFDVS